MTAQPTTDSPAQPLRVAVYARISKDRSGMALGVEDQTERGRAYATLHGYTVVAVEQDNDISGFKGQHRPGYERVMRLARSGQIDAVVVFHLSRWTRNRIESASFIEDFKNHGVDVHEAQGMTYQLGTATGRYFAGQVGLNNTLESEIKSERVKAALERRVKVGRHVSHPGYGWRSTGATSLKRGYELHPEQAQVIRDLARAVADGRSLRGLARELNEQGVPAPGAFTTSGEVPMRFRAKGLDPSAPAPRSYDGPDTLDPPMWAAMTIKQVLARKSNVGLLVVKGAESPAAWPRVLNDDLYAAVMRRLEAGKGKAQRAPRAGRRVNLLTGGVAFCGVCDSTLVLANRRIPKKDGTVRINSAYRCPAGCVQRRVDHLDTFARDALVARLSRPDALTWLMGDEGEAQAATEELATLTRQQEEAAEAYADGLVTIAQLKAINAKVEPRIAAARHRLDRATSSVDLGLLQTFAGPKAHEAWDRMEVAQRRLALEVVSMRIVVGRSVPTGLPLTELDQATVELSFG